jgi:hypothetical protein
MKVTVSVTLEADDDTPAVVHEVFSLKRGALAPDTVGLQLAEAKDLLSAVQEKMVNEQEGGVSRPGCLSSLWDGQATQGQGGPRHRGAQSEPRSA